MKSDVNLYKYRKCSLYSFNDLFNFEMSFVSLNHFNDAMEGYIPYSKTRVYEILTKKKAKRFYKMLIEKESQHIVFSKEDENIEQFFEKTHDEQLKIVSSKSYKANAIAFIDDFAKKLFNEIRYSFFVSSFSETGGHPVMWSHYADDSSGFVEAFNKSLLANNFHSFVINEFKSFDNNQLKIPALHQITYGKRRDCTDFIVRFILHSYRAGETDINKFMKYVKETGDYETLIYILTNKMKEWEYEQEWRLIIPRLVTSKKKIVKEMASNYFSDFRSLSFDQPATIICGENIARNNMAALAFYCKNTRKDRTDLYIQKRDFTMIEENSMKIIPFSDEIIRKKKLF